MGTISPLTTAFDGIKIPFSSPKKIAAVCFDDSKEKKKERKSRMIFPRSALYTCFSDEVCVFLFVFSISFYSSALCGTYRYISQRFVRTAIGNSHPSFDVAPTSSHMRPFGIRWIICSATCRLDCAQQTTLPRNSDRSVGRRSPRLGVTGVPARSITYPVWPSIATLLLDGNLVPRRIWQLDPFVRQAASRIRFFFNVRVGIVQQVRMDMRPPVTP